MTAEQIKALIEAQLNKSGWTVADNGECRTTDSEESNKKPER